MVAVSRTPDRKPSRPSCPRFPSRFRRRCYRRRRLPAPSRSQRRWPARRSVSPTKLGSVCLRVARLQPELCLPLGPVLCFRPERKPCDRFLNRGFTRMNADLLEKNQIPIRAYPCQSAADLFALRGSAILRPYTSTDYVQHQANEDQGSGDNLEPRFAQLHCRRLIEHDKECKQHHDPADNHNGRADFTFFFRRWHSRLQHSDAQSKLRGPRLRAFRCAACPPASSQSLPEALPAP